jgi:predicted extracellular nuclease
MRVPTLHRRRAGLAAVLGAALVAAPLVAAPASANPAGTGLVISEVYAGAASPAVSNDYVELYNPTAADIPAAGLSIQYRGATNSGAIVASQVYLLDGVVPAHGHYLLAGGSTGGGTALPEPDVTTSLNMGSSAGQVYLVAGTTGLAATTPGNQAGVANVLDMVGYGSTVVNFEGAKAGAPNATQSIARTAEGVDSDNNSVDFVAGAPSPEVSGVEDEPEPDPTPATIEQIQGSTGTSPLVGTTVITRGVVTAAYPTGGFNGYYIQTPGTGAIAAGHNTSSAVFVFSSATAGSVKAGDYVEVTGEVSEYNGLTEVSVSSADDLTVLPDAVSAPTPVTSAIGTGDAAREPFEGMLVAPSGDWTVTDNYDLNAYGSVVLNPGTSPLLTPTAVAEPGAAAVAYAAENTARMVTLDDGSSINFQGSDANKDIPLPYVTKNDPWRVGSAVRFSQPVILDYRNSGWNFQPRQRLTAENASTVQPATATNTRPVAPADLGGDVTLASFNVLNYFPTTGDQLVGCKYYTDRDGKPITVNEGCSARGAANAENLARQQAKIVEAINGLGADVVSLEEIENSVQVGKARDYAVSVLVDALNAAAGSPVWAFVPSPLATPTQQDVIRTAFIYKKAIVTPVDSSVILDDPAFVNARQPLAQEFKRVGGVASDTFLAIVNHFKSKGSGTGANADQGDGQGASNADRVAQAKALVSFADRMKTAAGTSRVFLTGDFNAYLKEDPIDVLTAAGYVDLGSTKTSKQTYSFDGAIGSLDHIFASSTAVKDVAAVDIWNINAYESIAFEYSRYNYNATDFYSATPYRSSDHDPILVGINLRTTIGANTPKIVGDAKVGATLRAKTGTWDPKPVKLSYRWLNNGKPISGATESTYKLKKSDKGDRISVRVTGTKSGYTTVVKTSASVKVYLALKATPKPKIHGTAKVGKTLSVTAGKWKPAKVTLRYQWYSNGKAIKGADEKKYHLKKSDKGDRITIKVTGSKKGYLTESETRSVRVR